MVLSNELEEPVLGEARRLVWSVIEDSTTSLIEELTLPLLVEVVSSRLSVAEGEVSLDSLLEELEELEELKELESLLPR